MPATPRLMLMYLRVVVDRPPRCPWRSPVIGASPAGVVDVDRQDLGLGGDADQAAAVTGAGDQRGHAGAVTELAGAASRVSCCAPRCVAARSRPGSTWPRRSPRSACTPAVDHGDGDAGALGDRPGLGQVEERCTSTRPWAAPPRARPGRVCSAHQRARRDDGRRTHRGRAGESARPRDVARCHGQLIIDGGASASPQMSSSSVSQVERSRSSSLPSAARGMGSSPCCPAARPAAPPPAPGGRWPLPRRWRRPGRLRHRGHPPCAGAGEHRPRRESTGSESGRAEAAAPPPPAPAPRPPPAPPRARRRRRRRRRAAGSSRPARSRCRGRGVAAAGRATAASPASPPSKPGLVPPRARASPLVGQGSGSEVRLAAGVHRGCGCRSCGIDAVAARRCRGAASRRRRPRRRHRPSPPCVAADRAAGAGRRAVLTCHSWSTA